MSDWSCTLTLTYRDHANGHHTRLEKGDFQKALKRLRKQGVQCRYIVAGEYGEQKGRTHFHALLFGMGRRPDWPQMQGSGASIKGRFWPSQWTKENRPEQMQGFCPTFWDHGHVVCDWNIDKNSVRYVCKYLLKWKETDSWFSLSRRPAIGHAWFQDLAESNIEAGLMPVNNRYFPPRGGRKRGYLMRGAVRRDFLFRCRQGLADRGLPASVLITARETVASLDKWDRVAWRKRVAPPQSKAGRVPEPEVSFDDAQAARLRKRRRDRVQAEWDRRSINRMAAALPPVELEEREPDELAVLEMQLRLSGKLDGGKPWFQQLAEAGPQAMPSAEIRRVVAAELQKERERESLQRAAKEKAASDLFRRACFDNWQFFRQCDEYRRSTGAEHKRSVSDERLVDERRLRASYGGRTADWAEAGQEPAGAQASVESRRFRCPEAGPFRGLLEKYVESSDADSRHAAGRAIVIAAREWAMQAAATQDFGQR